MFYFKFHNSRKTIKQKLGLQKTEYEQIIKRHLTFIDKLIIEKDEVAKKCENVNDVILKLEKGFNEKVLFLIAVY